MRVSWLMGVILLAGCGGTGRCILEASSDDVSVKFCVDVIRMECDAGLQGFPSSDRKSDFVAPPKACADTDGEYSYACCWEQDLEAEDCGDDFALERVYTKTRDDCEQLRAMQVTGDTDTEEDTGA